MKFKNVELSTLGIIVENVPTISKGKKNITTYTIEGRNGFLSVDNGTYQPFVITCSCHFNTANSLDDIKSALDGCGYLTLDNQRQYYAYVSNQIDFEKVAQANFRKFALQFTCNPIAEDIDATNVTSPSSVVVGGTYPTQPIFTLTGSDSATLTINNQTIYFTDLDSTKTYTLDCKLKLFYDSSNANCSSKMNGGYPELIVGTNTISSTLTTLSLSYRRCWL